MQRRLYEFSRACLNLARRMPLLGDLLALGSLYSRQSYLKRMGWFGSYRQRIPVSANGEPIPWFSYAAIRFLEDRLHEKMDVFEYGSGYSTLWWAKRVGHVFACEHENRWFDRIASVVPANVTCERVAIDQEDSYAKKILECDRTFDIVSIDGRERVACARHALEALSPEGVIVWDDTKREKYQPGFDMLAEHGFRRIDFLGPQPRSSVEGATTIFYRDNNVLNI